MAISNEVQSPTAGAPRVMPRARERGAALLARGGPELVQRLLFAAGALLLPLGLIVICLGWYGAANTPYEYDQNVYLLSGGALGLGLTFAGGFLYFGSWLARISADQRATQQRLEESLRLLAAAVSQNAAPAPAAPLEVGSEFVVAGDGTTLHRRDCDLIAGRADLKPATANAGLAPCRLCKP
ncbi:MAG TPA: hypothetical protein VLI04_14490 [Nocardioidaceae bacterium]|nr:hypothetical protein [Nocardioidaceae bacterium]